MIDLRLVNDEVHSCNMLMPSQAACLMISYCYYVTGLVEMGAICLFFGVNNAIGRAKFTVSPSWRGKRER